MVKASRGRSPARLDGLIEEIERLRQELTALTGQGLEEGIVQLPVAQTARRLDTLRLVLRRAEVVDDRPCGAIGRRATICDENGDATSFEIVLPGDGDPGNGCVSAESPLGAAVLGARSGDLVVVSGPGGSRNVRVLSID